MFFLYNSTCTSKCITLLHIFFYINIYEAELMIVYDQISPRFKELSNYIYAEDCTIFILCPINSALMLLIALLAFCTMWEGICTAFLVYLL